MSNEHAYRIQLTEVAHTYVAADSKQKAKSFALSNVSAERLTLREVMDLTRRGIAIVSAETGRVCNGRDEEEPQA